MKSTPDICDENPNNVKVLNLPFKIFGKVSAFFGQVVTVSCFEDNSKVKQLLATEGKGKVLLVDGQSSMNRALLGDNLASNAINNNWSGIVIVGPIRDCEIIEDMEIGVKALGTHPMKTKKEDKGEINVSLSVAGVTVEPGDYLYSDKNGVIISKEELSVT